MLTPLFTTLVLIAVIMTLILSLLLTKSATVKTGIDTVIVTLLLVMMIVMLIGPAYLYLTTFQMTVGDVVEWEIGVFSSIGMIPIICLQTAKFVILTDPERAGKPLPLTGVLDHIGTLRTSYVVLLVLSEVLMGWTFNIAAGIVTLASGYSFADVLSEISYSITTYWFVFTMVGEMFLTIFVLRRMIQVDMLRLLGLQALVMLVTPTALPLQAWETYSFYVEAGAMTAVVAFAILYARRRAEGDGRPARYLVFFIVANTLMMVGLLWWLVSGETWILAPVLLLETVAYFDAVLTGSGILWRGNATV